MPNLDSPQWRRAQQTSLWKRTLGSDDEDVKPLRDSFLDARKNADYLLDKIRVDFPNLTVHDITHVDSLWSVADTIINKERPDNQDDFYLVNSLEGYILGIAFLIHDAALSYDAVEGQDKLRETIEWKDAYADGPGDMDEEEFKKECDFYAIRTLHAQKAERILFQSFKRDNGTTFYIVDQEEYRIQFGDLIGKIAASHHWSIDEVESKLETQINPLAELPSDWEINAKKLACILRCADAGHIDNGRAPYGIYNSLIVNGVSRDHWESQSRLGQVRENRQNPEQLLITSTRPFPKKSFAAWNVAYDAVRLFDEEIKKSNNLLKTIDVELVFPHTGVMGANSKEELAEYIKTEGWKPCSFGVHSSNIKTLIESLGGSKLYGEKNMLRIVLRELIQNARDAIHARQKLQESFDYGRITIRLKKVGSDRIIEVEDNGIGMSMDCIKHHLLDFGSSYWKSPLSRNENPGLRSKGFSSVGKFGIGFYSVFMIAKSVEVLTKRYKEDSVKDAKRIEFPEGFTLSPILSECEIEPGVSTVVKLRLKTDDYQIGAFWEDDELVDRSGLFRMIPILVAGLDTDVYLNDERIHVDINSPDFNKYEWLENMFFVHPLNLSDIADRLEFIQDANGHVRGLFSINAGRLIWSHDPDWRHHGFDFSFMTELFVLTINGLCESFKSYDQNGFFGFLDFSTDVISRDKYYLDESFQRPLFEWFKTKYFENYYMIRGLKNRAKNYRTLFEVAKFNDRLKKEIIDLNVLHLYMKDRSKVTIGTILGFKKIYHFLYSGINENPKVIDFLNSENTEVENRIDNLPENNFEEIALKLLLVISSRFFLLIVAKETFEVWANLMLDRLSGEMIDWDKIPKSLDELSNEYCENKNLEQICSCLKPSLCKTDEYLKKLISLENE